MNQNIESKTILAKLMSTENLIVEHRKVKTASFDVKNRILTIPILDNKISNEVYDLFVGHEVGHALYTTVGNIESCVEHGVHKGIMNVVEDARIEKKIKAKYPGLRSSFHKAYSELNKKDFFGIGGKSVNDMKLIDRINLHFKIGPTLGVVFDEEENIIVDDISKAETFDDVVDISKRIMELMSERYEEQRSDYDDWSDTEDEDEDEDGYELDETSGDDELDYDTEVEKNNKDTHSSNKSNNEEEFEDEDEDDETETKIPNNYFDSETEKSYQNNEHKLLDQACVDYLYLNLPDINSDDYIVDYKTIYSDVSNFMDKYHLQIDEHFFNTRKENNKIVSYLVKEFELKKNADQLKKVTISKTGDLNMNKIYSYSFNEDIFKKSSIVPEGKSHGLVLFLDWSGSMHIHMENTLVQLLNIVLFCKKVNIPFEVYAFQSISQMFHTKEYETNGKPNDVCLQKFRLLNFFSSKMNATEMKKMFSFMLFFFKPEQYGFRHALDPVLNDYNMFTYFSLNSTPLNDTIIIASDVISKFQKKYKLQTVNTIFLTDGESDPTCKHYCEVDDIDTVGKSLGPVQKKIVRRNHQRTNNIIIRDPKTNMQEKVSSMQEMTNILIKLLKYRTKCNVIGFYVMSQFELKRNMYKYSLFDEYNNLKSKFKKDKYLTITAAGFDEYYFIRSDKHDQKTNEDSFTFDSSFSSKKIASMFTKNVTSKLSNRVMLNKFINLIT